MYIHKLHVYTCTCICTGSSVGRASVRSAECRGFESHLRQLSFFIFPLPQVSFFLSFFLSSRITSCMYTHTHIERHSDTQIHIERHSETHRYTQRQRHRHSHTSSHTHRNTERETHTDLLYIYILHVLYHRHTLSACLSLAFSC